LVGNEDLERLKLLVICSELRDPRRQPGLFEKDFDSSWADRFLQHLRGERELCTGCGDRCVHCRDWRVPHLSEAIAGVIRVPSILPELLDDPSGYLPETLPRHDVLIAIQIHEEILLELPTRCAEVGGKALIAPVESPEWVSRWAKNRLIKTAGDLGLEAAIPKPFCSLSPGSGATIDAFIEYFRVGRPVVEIGILDGRVAKATALISAPCGNSHYVAHSLQGHALNKDLRFEVSRYWHSFPCTASMKSDSELGGDTILHLGGQIHMASFCQAAETDFRKKYPGGKSTKKRNPDV